MQVSKSIYNKNKSIFGVIGFPRQDIKVTMPDGAVKQGKSF